MSPRVGEGVRVGVEAVTQKESGRLTRDPGSPVHHRPKDVEEHGADFIAEGGANGVAGQKLNNLITDFLRRKRGDRLAAAS